MQRPRAEQSAQLSTMGLRNETDSTRLPLSKLWDVGRRCARYLSA